MTSVFITVPTVPTTLVAQTMSGALKWSTDRGDTWTEVEVGLPPGVDMTSLAVDSRRPTVLFAGTTMRGVYRSHDAGRTWRPTGRTTAPSP
jgi:photosystem II stability/assembly factor-like uncharacterized protein